MFMLCLLGDSRTDVAWSERSVMRFLNRYSDRLRLFCFSRRGRGMASVARCRCHARVWGWSAVWKARDWRGGV